MSFFQLAVLWFRNRVLRDRSARWDHQYATGRWDKLRTPAEEARFDATARLLTRHARGGHVLEIGCGEALLQQRLMAGDYRSWLGVDISAVAIGRAQAFAGPRVRYVVADMDTLDSDGRFDAIVFTESIYYSADCRRLLRRYAGYLNPTGVFIVSIFRTRRSAAVWADIRAEAATRDAIGTTNELGTWDCEVLAPKAAPMAPERPA